ncbi:MAG: hypothetical protein AB1461_09175 [Thermodesulfobacteriota bacterium]
MIPTGDASTEKREHTRFKVQETVFAVLESDIERQPALVVNVGQGGVCLHYFRDKYSCNWQKLTISSFYPDCFLGQLPVEIVYDGPVRKEDDAPANGMRCCGLKFATPTFTQQALWNLFLEHHIPAIHGQQQSKL